MEGLDPNGGTGLSRETQFFLLLAKLREVQLVFLKDKIQKKVYGETESEKRGHEE